MNRWPTTRRCTSTRCNTTESSTGTRKARGKTVGWKLTEGELGLYREWIENNRELERLVKEMRRISSRVLALITGRQAPYEPPRLRLPGDGGGHCHPANAASRPLTLARPAASGKTRPNTPFARGSVDWASIAVMVAVGGLLWRQIHALALEVRELARRLSAAVAGLGECLARLEGWIEGERIGRSRPADPESSS